MVNLTDCEGEPAPYFDCPLRVALDGAAWKATKLVPAIKPPRFLAGPPSKLPEVVRCSHLRVLLPDGMDDSELLHLLESSQDLQARVKEALDVLRAQEEGLQRKE